MAEFHQRLRSTRRLPDRHARPPAGELTTCSVLTFVEMRAINRDMALIGMFKGKGANGFGYNSTAQEVTQGLDLSGKTYLVTGCNSGLGLETLRILGLRGGHVIGAARTVDKASAALQVHRTSGTPVACDLADPASIRACVQSVQELGKPIDALIGNAGIMALPKRQTIHGYEAQFFTNHVGHFILVTGLLDTLTDNGRVVMVSSAAHSRAPKAGIVFDDLAAEKHYSSFGAYGQSKLANLLFARHLAKRLNGTRRTANALHPGVIRTNIARHLFPGAELAMAGLTPLLLKNTEQGAATQCYLATHADVEGISGKYFADCNPATTTKNGADMTMAARLWEVTEYVIRDLG